MRRLETIGEVASRFARVEPGFPASYFKRQIKHYVSVGLVRPPFYQGMGRTSAALFAERQICAAYLFSALTRLGLRAEQLGMVARYCDAIGIRREDDDKYFGGLREVIDDTKSGHKRWFLIVKVIGWARDEGSESPPVYGEFREQANVTSDAEGWLSVVMLDCRRLLRPLLDDMSAYEMPPDIMESPVSENGGSEATTPRRPRRRSPPDEATAKATPIGARSLVSYPDP